MLPIERDRVGQTVVQVDRRPPTQYRRDPGASRVERADVDPRPVARPIDESNTGLAASGIGHGLRDLGDGVRDRMTDVEDLSDRRRIAGSSARRRWCA